MIEVRRTDEFITWLRGLRDLQAQARIIVRLRRVEEGDFGDAKALGEGVSELRFTFGPGYRVYIPWYYTERAGRIVLLLGGGDKASQDRDIARARELAKEIV